MNIPQFEAILNGIPRLEDTPRLLGKWWQEHPMTAVVEACAIDSAESGPASKGNGSTWKIPLFLHILPDVAEGYIFSGNDGRLMEDVICSLFLNKCSLM